MLEFLIPVVIGIFLGTVIVHIYQAWRIYRELSKMSEETLETLEKLDKETLIILEVEPVNDQFLCYNHFTKDFVCMGRNMAEVQERFQQRYPNREAAIIKEDLAAQQLKAT